MGRRSRKRTAGTPAAVERVEASIDRRPAAPAAERPARGRPAAAAAERPAPRRRARLDEAPKPPWAPVPLTELCLLVGLVVLGVAMLAPGGRRNLLLAFGLGLVTLATLEVSLREHLAGFRSHSALLAALAAMAAAVPVALVLSAPKAVVLIVFALVFLLALQALRAVFRRRAGGVGWRA